MPLYEYRCGNGHTMQTVRSIHEDEPALVECPQCSSPMHQVLGGVAITFKGKGFYTTDKGNG
jgi:putative FmdB family regulatory protein